MVGMWLLTRVRNECLQHLPGHTQCHTVSSQQSRNWRMLNDMRGTKNTTAVTQHALLKILPQSSWNCTLPKPFEQNNTPLHYLMTNLAGRGCQQQSSFLWWVLPLSTWLYWKATVDVQKRQSTIMNCCYTVNDGAKTLLTVSFNP